MCFDSSWTSAAAGRQISSSCARCGNCHNDASRITAATVRDERRSQAKLIEVRLAYGKMFPLSDVIPSRTRPVVTVSLIAVNTLMFLYQLQLDEVASRRLVLDLGVIPAYLSYGDIVTSMFLHGDFLHFLGNMVFLWIFGDNVEDRVGHQGFLLFYVGTGGVAALAQILANPASVVPMIGASGAIAGVMGAYFVLYPHSRILTAIFFFLILDIIEIPAIFFLGVWFLLQVLHGSLSSGVGGGVAFWAHAGGFAAGLLIGAHLRARDRATRQYWRDVG